MCFPHGERDFADVMKDLEMKDCPRLFGWARCICKRPYKREAGVSEGGHAMMEAEVRVRQLPEEAGRSRGSCRKKRAGAEERRRSLDAGKGQEVDSPSEHQEKMQSCQHLDFSPVKLILGF